MDLPKKLKKLAEEDMLTWKDCKEYYGNKDKAIEALMKLYNKRIIHFGKEADKKHAVEDTTKIIFIRPNDRVILDFIRKKQHTNIIEIKAYAEKKGIDGVDVDGILNKYCIDGDPGKEGLALPEIIKDTPVTWGVK
jgi:hypothetical protein